MNAKERAWWHLLQIRFMYNVIYLLNRLVPTPKTEGDWELESDLLDEFNQHRRKPE